ncbi:hypothetical protein PV10_01253 [Exophiala mesophila]|uniref:Tim44-like domain-containing protein n=1 Tax=Exophiala mesophila TaxID=212818 RepID=A0A0D1X6R9_EXOME|nr:uncharacterized protein PV10_01253 [Exophiala mesophila]KIV97505.1 hypothetical protein PV10_01253 [Exophiala mesophila]
MSRLPRELYAPNKFTSVRIHTSRNSTMQPRFQCTRPSTLPFVRHFSASPYNKAIVQQMKASGGMPPQKARKTQLDNMSLKDMGTDLGRLPGIVILPAWKDQTKTVRALTKLYWEKLKQTGIGLLGLFQFYKWDVPRHPKTGKKMRRPLLMSSRTAIARQMHVDLNQAISQRSALAVSELCCSGLANECRGRFAREREQRTKPIDWKLVKYKGIQWPSWLQRWPLSFFLFKSPIRVVSDQLTVIPVQNNSFLREMIVRIRSIQSVQRPGESTPTEIDIEEYVVLQQLIIAGELQNWRVWGTIQPSKEELELALSGKHKQGNITAGQAFKDRVASLTGMPL